MKQTIFLVSLLMLLFFVVSVDGVLLTNSKFSATIPAGESRLYEFTVSPEKHNGETVVTFESTKVEGDPVCADWITVDHNAFRFETPTKVSARINVPKDAFNSRNGTPYACFISMSTPSQGFIKAILQAPVYITVVNGQIPPELTPTADITTIIPTPAPTPQKTVTIAPPAAVPATQETAEPERWLSSSPVAYSLVGVGILAMCFFVVMMYDIRRAKKK